MTIAANFFHPVYRGKKLLASHRDQFDDYIMQKLGTEGLESCRMYTSEEGIFATLADKKLTPKTYWFYADKHKHSELSKFASKLLKIPASTAQLERLFSNWKFVHSDVRNRLGEQTSKKLLNIYFSLRSNDALPDDDDIVYESIDD